MNQKLCFLFGHATISRDMVAQIKAVAQYHYLNHGIRTFVVGNRGDFDRHAAAAICSLKKQYPDITLLLLLAYHPSERAVTLSESFDNSYYPPLGAVPKPFSIVRANRYMVKQADSIICYATHPGNARNLLDYARQLQKKKAFPIDNVGE